MSDGKPVLITPGDPAGIGPEIALRAWANGTKNIVLMGSIEHLSEVAKASGLNIDFIPFDKNTSETNSSCRVMELDWPVYPQPGTPAAQNAPVIISAIEQAVQRVKAGQFSAVVTNPISKSVLYEHGFEFPGHTEFLAALDGPNSFPVMMLANAELRAVPLTIHIPLSAVEAAITAELFTKTIYGLEAGLHRYFGCHKPRIAVAGLNPHAGEGGHIGRFEADTLPGLMASAQIQKASLSGPYSADSLFHADRRADYDAVLCMYHDQALIPVKTIDFHNTVNVTLGLDFIRTSPDHGTAFDRAAGYNSSPDSLISAIRMAQNMADCAQNG